MSSLPLLALNQSDLVQSAKFIDVSYVILCDKENGL